MSMSHYTSIIAEIRKRVHFVQEEFDQFADGLAVVELRPHEIWEAEGKVAQKMGFVNRGLLRQFAVKDGKEYTDLFFSENEFIGNYISYLQQEPVTAICQALEPCELLVIPFATLESMYAELPVVEEFSRIIGNEKLFQLEERRKSLLMSSPEERYQEVVRDHPGLLQRIPQYMLAQYLGIRPETLSRIRKRSLS